MWWGMTMEGARHIHQSRGEAVQAAVKLESPHQQIVDPRRVYSSLMDTVVRECAAVGVDIPRRSRVSELWEGPVVDVLAEHHPLNTVVGSLEIPVAQRASRIVVAMTERVPSDNHRQWELNGHRGAL